MTRGYQTDPVRPAPGQTPVTTPTAPPCPARETGATFGPASRVDRGEHAMSWFARGRRGTARASVILLVGLAAAFVAAPGYGAASGTLTFSLNPDSTVMAPGDTVMVTVKNIEASRSTTVLIATLTNPGAFQKVDGCTGVA